MSQSKVCKMLSIETCLKILNQNEKKYSREQADMIRRFLYQLSVIDYENFKEKSKTVKSSHLHTR